VGRPWTLGAVRPRTLGAAACAQAVKHAVELLLAAGAGAAAPPAARPLLATLASLLATARAPGAAPARRVPGAPRRPLQPCGGRGARRAARRARRARSCPQRCARGRQGMFCAYGPDLLSRGAELRAAGNAVPTEPLPYAAAQLLPLLLPPPESVRALDLPLPCAGGTDGESDFFSRMLVRARLPAVAARPRSAPPRAPTGSAAAQVAIGELAARGGPEGCQAVVPACAGLVPFAGRALCAPC